MSGKKTTAGSARRAPVKRDVYRVISTATQLSTLFAILVGGLSAWSTFISNLHQIGDTLASQRGDLTTIHAQLTTLSNDQTTQKDDVKHQGDDIKALATQLQIVSDKVTSVQIGLAGKQDRK